MVKDKNRSLFNSTEEIGELLPKDKNKTFYVAMIAIGEKELHPAKLTPCNGKSIEGIRLTFHQDEIKQAISWAKVIKDKGYKIFMQPVGTTFYTDIELLKLVDEMNELNPYAFYIVDTLGSMYRNEVSYKFHLIDQNMRDGILLGFHGHNNLQLAFSNAQILGKIQTKRDIIIDSSVYGMGRGAGNLPTELITQYINKNIESKYDVTMVMDVYDDYIYNIRRTYEWGYTIPYNIAASHVCHPNYASYLINKKTLTMKDIEKIIQLIPSEDKVCYNKGLIEEIYNKFYDRKVDDSEYIKLFAEKIKGKKILIISKAIDLLDSNNFMRNFIDAEKPYIISVNCIGDIYFTNACFINNNILLINLQIVTAGEKK